MQAGTAKNYEYDANGNLVLEQDGEFEGDSGDSCYKVKQEADNVYSTDYGWGLFKEEISSGETKKYSRTYTWNESNQLISSTDSNYSVAYIYGQDGQRTNKYTRSSETLYFNKMWTVHTDSGNSVYGGQSSKNIYLGETRLVTKLNSGTNPTYQEEYYKQYFYHSDHLGSASLISDYKGDEYQRIEYTPYGETWVEKTENTGFSYLPYKFTAKEKDEETGLYYFGARYYDARYSRWLSCDPALGEYVPGAGADASKLPGMGGVYNTVNLNLYHYAGNSPVKYVDPTGMWDDKVHYDRTYKWAQASGFSEKDSKAIAKACNGVDSIFGGKSFLPSWLGGDQSYHFNTSDNPSGTAGDTRIQHSEKHLQQAIADKNEAMSLREKGGFFNKIKAFFKERSALKNLGQGLHALQDVNAHSDEYVRDYFQIGNIKLNGIKSHELTDPNNKDLEKGTGRPHADSLTRKIELDKTETDTKAYLKRYLEATGGVE